MLLKKQCVEQSAESVFDVSFDEKVLVTENAFKVNHFCSIFFEASFHL